MAQTMRIASSASALVIFVLFSPLSCPFSLLSCNDDVVVLVHGPHGPHVSHLAVGFCFVIVVVESKMKLE